jgi:hypothetical protein
VNWLAAFIGGPAYAAGATLLRHWKWVALGSLAIFAGIQTLRLSWAQTALEKLTAKIAVMAAITNETDKKWRATESTWKVKTAQIVKDKDNEIQAIDAERDAALAKLRNRPRRPAPGTAQSPANGEAASGCTGARLFGDDAEFLIREAARADTIRVALNACYAQYDMISEAP